MQSTTPPDPSQPPAHKSAWNPILLLLAETVGLCLICVLPAVCTALFSWVSVDTAVRQGVNDADATATLQAQSMTAEPPAGWNRLDAAFISPGTWFEGKDTDKLGRSQITVTRGAYIWELHSYDGVIWWQTPKIQGRNILTDFYVTVDAARAVGTDRDTRYGLLFRYSNDKFYVFGISNSSLFSIDESSDDDWTSLQDWTASSSIQSDMINRLTVLGKGTHFWFFINNQLVQEVENPELKRGEVGVFHEVNTANEDSTIIFENFALYIPPN